jgi:hypothetical protein
MQKLFSLKTYSGKSDNFVFARHFVTSSVTCKNRYAKQLQAGNKMFTPYFNVLKRNGYIKHQEV